jgi:hypothetical protein
MTQVYLVTAEHMVYSVKALKLAYTGKATKGEFTVAAMLLVDLVYMAKELTVLAQDTSKEM